jgi:mannose-6-phosphate isomerase-like protein (cupin superfamily)
MQPRSATYDKAYDTPPQLSDAGSRTWISRGANFVVAVSDVAAGAALARADNPDEYMVLCVSTPATIEAGTERIDAERESLTIVPPGRSTVTATTAGRIVRIFSNLADDMARLAANAAIYAAGAAEVAPLVPWPAPPGGFKLRNYTPFAYDKPETNMRIFRSTNLMVNVMTKRGGPRDTKKLSPHSHDDFEQASVVLEGDYQHHLRWPWTPDQSEWRADDHVEIGSPSITVIPAKVVHTSNNVGPRRSWLIDVFAPPRVDFSRKPGMVINTDDYPMPAES